MNVGTGEVLYDTKKSHAAKDVVNFFKLIDLHVPADLELHVILDKLSAHKAEAVKTWLGHPKRKRWHLHFIPTSSSWLNVVEGWFSILTNRRLKKGVFNSLDDLVAGHRDLGRALERRPHTLRVEEVGRRDRGQSASGSHRTGFSQFRDGPLGRG